MSLNIYQIAVSCLMTWSQSCKGTLETTPARLREPRGPVNYCLSLLTPKSAVLVFVSYTM